MISLTQSVLLAIWAAFCILDLKSFKIALFSRPLLCGFGAGIIMGDIPLGLSVGGTLELASMGLWNFGGATIPDYTCATIIGVAIGATTGESFESAIAVAVPVALLFTYFDVIAMTFNTMYVHKADKMCDACDVKGLNRMHNWGFLTWAVTRGVPVFLACYFGSAFITSLLNSLPSWFFSGISAAGKLMPCLGISLLLRSLPVKKYFPYIIGGYVLAAYLKLSFIAIALVGVAIIGIIEISKKEIKPAKSNQEDF